MIVSQPKVDIKGRRGETCLEWIKEIGYIERYLNKQLVLIGLE